MAIVTRHLLRRSPASSLPFLNPHIHCRSYSSTSGATSHIDHQRNHEFLSPNDYIGSWKPPKDPKEAQSQLAHLRREYALKVKAARKEYIREVEFLKLEKQKKDLARKEALRIANEERKAAKDAEKAAKAKEREVAAEEFRQTLLKERAEKLEHWRMRTQKFEEKKKQKKELLHRQSSLWVSESELEKKALEAIVDSTPL
ncbi:OLC1v1028290C1 [Oldenlandia corymbosa var. corymbosa]|uniref:OLC1v1028290C1 n=1 Tax=Oldenlandia corymbosa var. corymbosa TaxID=529605 RepID=A0AAV1CE90_OLDCO|nr:OLC1v1028290C1 [Oldenlandia corymbosa var. corymbosa]